MFDHDDEPPTSEAEVEAWWESDQFWSRIDRAFAEIAEDIPPQRREWAESLFTLGALAFEGHFLKALREKRIALAGLKSAEKGRRAAAAARDQQLLSDIADYRRRHPDASDREMAKNLALRSGVPVGTVRHRLRSMKARAGALKARD